MDGGATWRQEETADHQGEAQSEEGEQVAEHDLPKQRRPLERQERADAAERECGHEARAEREPHRERAQPIAYGLKRQLVDPLARPRGRPPEQPFGAEAQRDEPGQEQQDSRQAV